LLTVPNLFVFDPWDVADLGVQASVAAWSMIDVGAAIRAGIGSLVAADIEYVFFGSVATRSTLPTTPLVR